MATFGLAVDARKAVKGFGSYTNAAGRAVDVNGRYIKSQTGVNSATKKSGRTISKFNLGPLKGMLAGFSALFILRDATKVIIGFDKQIAELGGITGATTAELEGLEKVARQLGATTAFSAQEAAEGLTSLARAGFSVAKSTAAIAGTLNLAIAGTLNLARSTDIVVAAIKTFGLEASDAGKVGDIFITSANNATTTVDELAEAMKFGGVIAGTLGISLENTSAALATLADNNIRGSLAGTGLRGVLASLIDPTEKGKKALNDMKLSVADVDVRARGLTAVLKTLRDNGINEGANAMRLFGRIAFSAGVNLSLNADRVEELTKANLNAAGAAQKMADIMSNTLSGKLKSLRSVVEELFLQVGDEGLAGGLKSVIEFSTDVLRIIAGTEGAMKDAGATAKSFAITLKILGAGIVALGKVMFTGFESMAKIIGCVGEALFGFESNLDRVFKAVGEGSLTFEDLEDSATTSFENVSAALGVFLVDPIIQAVKSIKLLWTGLTDFIGISFKLPLVTSLKLIKIFVTTINVEIAAVIDKLAVLALAARQTGLGTTLQNISRSMKATGAEFNKGIDAITKDTEEKLKASIDKIALGIEEGSKSLLFNPLQLQESMEKLNGIILDNQEKLAERILIRQKARLAEEVRLAEEAAQKKKEAEEKALLGSIPNFQLAVNAGPAEQVGGDNNGEVSRAAELERQKQEARLNIIRDSFKTEQELMLEKALKDSEFVFGLKNEELIGAEEQKALLLQIEDKFLSDKRKLQKANAEEEARARKQALLTTLDTTKSIGNSLLSIAESHGQQSEKKRKKFARAQVIINTAIGIARAFADLGWPAGIAAAAVAAASGAAQLAAINSAGGGGGTISAPSSAGGGGAEPSGTPPSAGPQEVRVVFEGLDKLSDDALMSGTAVRNFLERASQEVENGAKLVSTTTTGGV